jgi:tetratricopeptide (TPR) repeat protein
VDVEPPRLSSLVTKTPAPTEDTVLDYAVLCATTPDRLRRRLRGDLDTIAAKALKKDPQERYPTVSALGDDLRRHLANQPIGARPDTVTYRAAKFARRHRAGVAAALGVVLLVAGLVGFYTVRLRAERDRARLQAEKAAKISQLLTGLLTGSDPYRDPGKGEPTVRTILDAGAERIRKELGGQPEIQAEMLTVIGRVYQRLGLPDKAQPLLEDALAIGRRAVGPEHERVAQSLNDLGVLLRDKNDLAAAAPLLEQALDLRRRLRGREHEDVAVTLVELGRLYSDQGLPARAEPLYREALAIRRKVWGESHRETATSLGELALLLWQQGDLAGAEPLFRQALATSRAVLGEDHPNVASSLNNLALLHLDKGDYAGAEPLLRQAVARNRKALGPDHPNLATNLNNLAAALREQGRHDEAAALLADALRIAGDDHPNLPALQVNLARVHLARGDAAAAEALLRRALAAQERTDAAEWRIGMTRSSLGEALTRLGRHPEAETLLLDAARSLEPGPGRQGREARANQARLAALYDAWGRPEKTAAYR